MIKKKLKIIIFEGSFTTTTFINRLIKGLAINHEVYVFGFNSKSKKRIKNVNYISLGSSQNYLSLIVRSIIISLCYIFKTGNLRSSINTIKIIFLLNKKQLQQENLNQSIKLINPDIIHVQWQSLVPWCEEFLLEEKYKIILSQRGYQSNVRPFVNQENLDYLQQWYPKVDGFHSVSNAISKTGDQIYHSESKIDKVVYSGFDFNELCFNSNYKKQNVLQILSVGRPHWIKGYDDALKACSILKQKGIDFHYTIVGASKNNEEILYLINCLGLESHIQLIDKIAQDEVYHYMNKSNVLIFPSIMEGLPNVVVEAMALGLPVISTKCGGVIELIEHEKTGWLVPTRNPDALANAIQDFAKIPLTKIEEIRLAARRKVEAQHSMEQMVLGMESLYLKVISN